MNENEDPNLIINPDVEPPKNLDMNESFLHYRKTLSYMSANVPLGVLCLPKSLEKILLRNGFIRVYDLIGCDFTKIEGVGDGRADLLASRLDEFFTVGI